MASKQITGIDRKEYPSISKQKIKYFDERKLAIQVRSCQASGWPKRDTGKTFLHNCFREMPKKDTNDFEKIKKLLLRRFVYIEDAFNNKFRTARVRGEDFSAFVVRLTTFFNRYPW